MDEELFDELEEDSYEYDMEMYQDSTIIMN